MRGCKKLIVVLAAALPVLCSGCFDFFVSYKIYPNGNTLAKIRYEFPDYGEYNLGYVCAPDIVRGLSNDGFRNVKNWYGEGAYHISGEKFGTIDMFSSSNGIRQAVTIDKKTGLSKTSYLFSMKIDRDKEKPDDESELAAGIMARHWMTIDVEMPGVITSTNGKKLSDNRIRFQYSMYNVFFGKEQLSMNAESTVSAKDRFFNASVRADNRLSELDGKIQEVGIRISEMKTKTAELEAYAPVLDKDIVQSNLEIAAVYNRLAVIYKKQFGAKPQSGKEITDFFTRKGVSFDLFPEPIDGTLAFDAEKGLFRIDSKGAVQ